MSGVKGKIGRWRLAWKTVPRGSSGSALLSAANGAGTAQAMEVRWKRDEHGIWIELPHGTFGFDLRGEMSDDGRMHFEAFERTGAGAWRDLVFLHAGEEGIATAAGSARKGVRVRAQMPGKIIRVIVAEGQKVERDQPIMVMEAMKMENEIRAPQAGKVGPLRVAVGQAVETGADLCTIEPEL